MADYNIIVKMATDEVSRGRRAVEGELGAMGRAADQLGDRLRDALGVAAVGAAIKATISTASAFEDKMVEVSTVAGGTAEDMDRLSQAALGQAAAFGSQPTQQAAALYDIISAGVSNTAQAMDILTVSNKLAVGGVTDVAVAADGLTSVMAAYAGKIEGAQAAADAMFVGAREGKTTIAELSGALGRVAPVAAQLNVSFDELVGAVSALTKGGISTNEAITGVRAILASVAKPASEAAELAQKLGLGFDTAALQAQGFAGFMDSVKEKTGGSTDALAILFGRVEALVPAMALSGQAGIDFTNIMGAMGDKAGQTQAAFEKVFGSSGKQFDVLVANATVKVIELGTALLSVLGPAMQFVNENFDTLVNLAGAAAATFLAYQAVTATVAAYNAVMSSTFGVLVGTVASTTAQFGIAAGAQVAFSAATAFTTTVVRGLLAALGPLGIALAVGGAAYALLSRNTNAATNATLAKAEADRIEAEAQSQRLAKVQALVQATAVERQQMLAAARDSITKAQASLNAAAADITAAKAALDRAVAERELAAAIRQKFDGGEDAKFGRLAGVVVEGGNVRAAQDALARERREAEAAEKRLVERRKDLEAMKASLAVKPTAVPTMPALMGGDDDKKGAGVKAGGTPATSFAEIKANLETEVRLAKESGVAREALAEQLRAEDAMRRRLAPEEAATIERLIREADAAERTRQYREQMIGALDRDNVLLRLNGVAREVMNAQLQAEEILRRKLTDAEKAEIEAKVRANDALAHANELLRNIRGPMEDYINNVARLRTMLAEGAISQREFNVAVADQRLSRDLLGVEKSLPETSAEAEREAVRRAAEEKMLIVDQAEQAGVRTAYEASQLRIAIAQDEARRLRALRAAEKSVALTAASDTFGAMAEMARDSMGEQSAIYKAMFAASKAFAIADSIVKIQQGIANALSLPFPANLGAVAAVAAQAASIVANIKAVTLAFADGGYVPGMGGRRQDNVPAMLSAGEFVVNANATAANRPLLEALNRGLPVRSGSTVGPVQRVGGGDVNIGAINIEYHSDGKDPEQDGAIMAREFERRVRDITRDELADQSRDGGALTRTGQSALTG